MFELVKAIRWININAKDACVEGDVENLSS